eukprot:575037-Rhodomonas_salina.1
MSGWDMVEKIRHMVRPRVLRARYAKSSTDIGLYYRRRTTGAGVGSCPLSAWSRPRSVQSAMPLRACCATSGTGILESAVCLRARYAMSGIGIACGAMQCPLSAYALGMECPTTRLVASYAFAMRCPVLRQTVRVPGFSDIIVKPLSQSIVQVRTSLVAVQMRCVSSCYAVSGTGRAYAAPVFCYAMAGTDRAYTLRGSSPRHAPEAPRGQVRACIYGGSAAVCGDGGAVYGGGDAVYGGSMLLFMALVLPVVARVAVCGTTLQWLT